MASASTELRKLKTVRSLKLRSRFETDSDNEPPRYTSLKELLYSNSPLTRHASLSYYGHHSQESFGSTIDIPIRNHLVKHAASAYLQSAVVIGTNRSQTRLVCVWRSVRIRVARLRTWWNVHVGHCFRSLISRCFV